MNLRIKTSPLLMLILLPITMITIILLLISNIKLNTQNELIKEKNAIMIELYNEYDKSIETYEKRINNLNNIISSKDVQINNITITNIELIEQLKTIKSDYDKITKHYVLYHDSIINNKNKY